MNSGAIARAAEGEARRLRLGRAETGGAEAVAREPGDGGGGGDQRLGRPADPRAPGLAGLVTQPDHEEAGREERCGDPGEDREGARPGVRDERRREQDDEEPQHRGPRFTRRDRQDGAGEATAAIPARRGSVARRSGRSFTGPGRGELRVGRRSVILNVLIGQ